MRNSEPQQRRSAKKKLRSTASPRRGDEEDVEAESRGGGGLEKSEVGVVRVIWGRKTGRARQAKMGDLGCILGNVARQAKQDGGLAFCSFWGKGESFWATEQGKQHAERFRVVGCDFLFTELILVCGNQTKGPLHECLETSGWRGVQTPNPPIQTTKG